MAHKSKIDRKRHDMAVLERKIYAYERVREAISNLAYEMRDDAYALEALNSIDRTIFAQLQFMYAGLMRLRDELKKLQPYEPQA
jgi:hypothetical protein